MVAESWNLHTSSGAGLEHRSARLHLYRLSVDEDLKEVAGGWGTCGQMSGSWKRTCLRVGGEKAMSNSLDDVALLLLS